jgi:N-hydroxyarylamine O-acetyltransferase
VCTLATSDGRVTLRDTRLIITRGDLKGEIPIDGENEFRTALREHYGIDLASQTA